MSNDMKPPKEEKQKVPSYIVTFSDMITLLLTFFVLLLSMASERVDDTKFERGREALINALSNVGIVGTSTSDKTISVTGKKVHLNPVDKDEKFTEDEALDAVEEAIRRIFKELEKEMDQIDTAHITGKSPVFRPMNIKFQNGKSRLETAAADHIKRFSNNLQQDIQSNDVTMYIIGMAPDAKKPKDKCIISAKRAQAVANTIRKTLPPKSKWKIHSWGAGSGGQWKTQGPVENSQVVIGLLGI